MATLEQSQQIVNVQEVMAYQPPALLIKSFCRKYEVSEPEARQQFEECKKFLVICGESPDQAHAPSLVIDEMWHSFVLHTQDYQQFCEKYLGRFIHHRPTERPEREAYLRTLSAYKERFGEAPIKYWPAAKAADCDSGVCQDYCSDGCNSA